MIKKKNILILSDTNLLQDGRIRRQIKVLRERYRLIVTGIQSPEIEGLNFVDCRKKEITRDELEQKRKLLRLRLLNKSFEEVYWGESYIKELYEQLQERDIDLILANDISMVPLGVRLSQEKKIPIIADMHEYAPREFEDLKGWMEMFYEYRVYLCQKYLTQCQQVFTVSGGIAEEYRRQFHIQCDILTNAPVYETNQINYPKDKVIKLVYHGVANPSRKLEKLLRIMKNLGSKYTLDLYLIGDSQQEYMRGLVEQIKQLDNVHLRNAVMPEDIVKTINKYDLGIFILEPSNFNYRYALPNKFFEFIQARLGVIIGPSCEMKKYVDEYQCGIVAEDYTVDKVCEEISKLDVEKIYLFKKNASKLAKKVNAEENAKILLEKIEELEDEEQ